MTAYLLTAPTAEPVTLADAKAAARLDGTQWDTIVTAAIVAAQQYPDLCRLGNGDAADMTPTPDHTAELMILGQIHGIVWGLRYMGYVGTQDNLVRR